MINIHIRACRSEVWIFVYGTLDPSPMQVHAGLLLAKNLNLRAHRYMESNQQLGKIVIRV